MMNTNDSELLIDIDYDSLFVDKDEGFFMNGEDFVDHDVAAVDGSTSRPSASVHHMQLDTHNMLMQNIQSHPMQIPYPFAFANFQQQQQAYARAHHENNAFSPVNATIQAPSFSLHDAPSLDVSDIHTPRVNHNTSQANNQVEDHNVFKFGEPRSFSFFGFPPSQISSAPVTQQQQQQQQQKQQQTYVAEQRQPVRDIEAPIKSNKRMRSDITPEKQKSINRSFSKFTSTTSSPSSSTNTITSSHGESVSEGRKKNSKSSGHFNKGDKRSKHNESHESLISNSSKYSRGSWSMSEDEMLRNLVYAAGSHLSWKEISCKIKTRNAKQCRERWTLNLNPDIYHGPFTAEEDAVLLEAHSRIGSKWTKIKMLLPGRTENSVKTRYKSLIRKFGKPEMSRSDSESSLDS